METPEDAQEAALGRDGTDCDACVVSVPLWRAGNTCLAPENLIMLLLSRGFFVSAVSMLKINP